MEVGEEVDTQNLNAFKKKMLGTRKKKKTHTQKPYPLKV